MRILRILLAVLILGVFASSSFATGLFTPMEPGLKGFSGRKARKRVSRDPVGAVFGVGYFHSSMKVEWGDGDTEKLEQNQEYAHIGFNITDDFEMYIRLGASDMEVAGAESAKNIFGTIGAGMTMYNDGFLTFGPIFQYSNYFNHTFQMQGQTVGKIDGLWDVNLGLSFKVTPNEWFAVQAAPFAYWARGDVKDADGTKIRTLREKSNYGGALTLRMTPFGPFSVDVEGQYKNGFSYGASLNYNF